MKALWFCLFFTSALCAPFSYDGKSQLHFTHSDFKRYVRPQLKKIKRDFFSLLNHFNPLYPHILRGREALDSLLSYRQALLEQCQKTPNNCRDTLQQLHRELINFELLLVELEHKSLSQKLMAKIPTRSTLWMKKYFALHLEVVKITGSVRAALWLHSTDPTPSDHLPLLLHSLQSHSTGFLFGLLEKDHQKLFSQVYHSFLSPIDKYVLGRNSKQYLTTNIEQLNFSWNDFHMKLAKTNRQFPQPVLSTAEQIHRRWTAVLRRMIGK